MQSFAAHRPLTVDPIDFAAFANALQPKMRGDNQVFNKKSWAASAYARARIR